MYDSFIDQLNGLDLSGLSIRPAPFSQTDFPCEDAIDQTLGAVWSDLFAMFSDTALEADAEDIAWGMVNLFHRAASRKSAQLDRASDEIRVLLASADGSEVHSSNLEEQVERAQAGTPRSAICTSGGSALASMRSSPRSSPVIRSRPTIMRADFQSMRNMCTSRSKCIAVSIPIPSFAQPDRPVLARPKQYSRTVIL